MSEAPSAADARWRSITVRIHPLVSRAYVHVQVQGHKGNHVEWRTDVLKKPLDELPFPSDPSTREVLAYVTDCLWEMLSRTQDE